MQFDVTNGRVRDDFRPEDVVLIEYDRWVEIRIVFDLDNDTQTTFYDGIFLSTGTMTRSAGDSDTRGGHVLSGSPERLLRRLGSVVSTWPIKGTRPRGENRTDDRRLVRELPARAKDNAELPMHAARLRNGLYRVASPGT